MSLPVIAIFDIGKTNKKFFLLSQQYQIITEHTEQFPEITDEDGFPCDDVKTLSAWVKKMLQLALQRTDVQVQAVNVSAYGASFVHLGTDGNPVAPLYNYLKPFPEALHRKFYAAYGPEANWSLNTASPVLGNLNSGLQLYRLKYDRPRIFENIRTALHLPQYISYLITGNAFSEITSIGCHTGLWDFTANHYHSWVELENMQDLFPPIADSSRTVSIQINNHTLQASVGLHDSSAALVPYLTSFSEPFILISTGTWCISMNPFNAAPLSVAELQQDCLCYLTYQRKPVKASRLFAGHEHELQTKRIAAHFQVKEDFFKSVSFHADIYKRLAASPSDAIKITDGISVFGSRDLEHFDSVEEAYHQLMLDIMQEQTRSTRLVCGEQSPGRIFVDGGFAKNEVYMYMLAHAFPQQEVYAASVSQATAMGAALAIHTAWNPQPVRGDMVQLKYYTVIR
jgi:sugar (pentulose or hexulose) kinase